MRAYYVKYIMWELDEEKGVEVHAKDKYDAYDKAVFELIPDKEGQCPYAAWVESVTYNNGNYKVFNTSCGNPF